jgi:hypothetical protein
VWTPWSPEARVTTIHPNKWTNSVMGSAKAEASKRLSLAWLTVMVLSAAMLTYGAFVVMNLVGLR